MEKAMDAPSDRYKGRKKEIFQAMSPRQQRRVLARGYDQWNPFEEPKEPIDLRKDGSGLTAARLASEFLREHKADKSGRSAYAQGVREICAGLLSGMDRYIGMYEFCCWYRDQCERRK